MDEPELANHLFEVAADHARLAGRRLGEGADKDLRAMTATGAAALSRISDPVERGKKTRKAESDLRRLIDSAISNALALEGYPSDLLGEQSYFPARLRFCPCRPFC